MLAYCDGCLNVFDVRLLRQVPGRSSRLCAACRSSGALPLDLPTLYFYRWLYLYGGIGEWMDQAVVIWHGEEIPAELASVFRAKVA